MEKLAGGLKRGLREQYNLRFPEGGPKRANPTVTTSTIMAWRKEDPQHYVEGMN